jgi:hypothetical protein
MFGKKSKMSSNDRAVMALGRKAGNLKGTNFGNNHGTKGGSKGTETPNPYKSRTLRVGKNSGFSDE